MRKPLKAWCTIYFTNVNPFLPGTVFSTVWCLWWEKWGLKALKFLQLHLFKHFLIILPWNYKNSRTRASLTINCASSICKEIQIKCGFVSPEIDSCSTWAPQNPTWTQFPIALLRCRGCQTGLVCRIHPCLSSILWIPTSLSLNRVNE